MHHSPGTTYSPRTNGFDSSPESGTSAEVNGAFELIEIEPPWNSYPVACKAPTMTEETDPPRPSTLPPGYDDEDPYENIDLSTLPDWWRESVELFREYGLRPYRPPQFEDGRITKEVIDELEADLGVQIRIRTSNPRYKGPWEIWVNDEPIEQIDRSRVSEGRTVYSISASDFEDLVRTAVTE